MRKTPIDFANMLEAKDDEEEDSTAAGETAGKDDGDPTIFVKKYEIPLPPPPINRWMIFL